MRWIAIIALVCLAGRFATVAQESAQDAEQELQKGTALTRSGSFTEAIPHLLAARGRVANEYAASFNLALCDVATRDFKAAIEILQDLRRTGHDGADVEDLLAQAYVGNGQSKEAIASLQKAGALSRRNEKLYLFVADSCADRGDYPLGLRVVDLGLKNLPQSAWLHYERGMILTLLDEFDQAKVDFELASTLAAGGEVAYLSAAQKDLFAGKIPDAIGAAREGIAKGSQNPMLLTVLGEALLRSGASPGEPEFAEAQTALERSVVLRPNDAGAQAALGRLYLNANRLSEAIAHLEKARQLEPGKPSVYANLAKAYQRHGNLPAAQEVLATLEKLNRAQAERISSAPGDRKVSYGATVEPQEKNRP